MIYRDFQGLKLSALGLGCMRLPKYGESDNQVDVEKTAEMVDYAIKCGVNYFDVAYGYHAGVAETVMGDILSKYPRDSFYLADKFPGYDIKAFGREVEIFEEQLKKCKVDYFDFYLIHNVCELNIEKYLSDDFPIDFYLEQLKNGRIKHFGFSCHGKPETHERFLKKYGKYMEFCQIQLNWLDWDVQVAKEKVFGLNDKGIPIWVMEPVRGGQLAKLDDENEAKLHKLIPDMSTVEVDFRFLQSLDGIGVTLSGMSNMDQLKQNIEIWNTEKKLTDDQFEGLLKIADDIASTGTVPCTGCRYCTSYCPQEIDIPTMIKTYNDHLLTDGGFRSPQYIGGLPKSKWPQACLGCGACSAVCPQKIDIPGVMADYSFRLKDDATFLRIAGKYEE